MTQRGISSLGKFAPQWHFMEQSSRARRWYEEQGFKRGGTFEVPDKWEKGLLFKGWFYEMRL